MELTEAKKRYRTVALMTFCVAIALLIMRIIAYYVQIAFIKADMEGVWIDLLNDAIFSVPVQLGILLLFPFLLYKLSLKKPTLELLKMSGYRRCNVWVLLLSVLIGFFVIGVSYGLSVIWQVLLILFGYTPSGGSELPETFNVGYFLLSVLLTAVLPAVCEEFTNRGVLLTTMRGSFSEVRTVALIAVVFGLFHQSVTQVFYTMALGGLLAFIVIKTGSIFPAMIIHFMNNFMSLYLDNAATYGWVGGGLNKFLETASFTQLTALFAICLLAVFGLTCAVVYISKKKRSGEVYIRENELVTESGFKPSLKDNIFFFGALAVSVVSTFITFLFGL